MSIKIHWIRKIRRIALCGTIMTALMACQTSPVVRPGSNEGVNPLSAMVRFYQGPLHHLSAVRTGQCPMYPSDSEYSLQALEKHGVFMGWIMSIDRLMRCGRDETRLAPAIRVQGRTKTYDPIEDNDFWWHETRPKTDASASMVNQKSE